MSSPRKLEVPGEDLIVLNILLDCELSKSSETKQLHFTSTPTNPLEIKKKVEESFSIPSCIQSLYYQTMLLKDTDELQHTHFRSGDTFTVRYQTRGDCERVNAVIEWLKGILKLLQSIKENDMNTNEQRHEEEDSSLWSYFCQMAEESILSGMQDGTAQDLCLNLLYPWKDKRTYVNKLHFQHEGGLEVLMGVYSLLVEKDWGNIGINSEFHLYMECLCSQAVANYTQTFPLRRQVVQLGGMEMCMKTLLRRKVGRNGGCEIRPDSLMKSALEIALYAVCNLSELPECQEPLAKRKDVIDQTMGIALHPAYDCKTAIVAASMILCLTQSRDAHPHLARSEVVESLLEMCDLKRKMVVDQTPQPQAEIEDPMSVNALQGYTSIILAQIGLGSPDLFYEAIPLHLQQQILDLMSDMLIAASPTEISQYEEKEGLVWGTFLPYLRFLYNPSTTCITADGAVLKSLAIGDNDETITAAENGAVLENSVISNIQDVPIAANNGVVLKSLATGHDGKKSLRTNLYIQCCNVLLHGLENALSRDIHFQILVKEGLLDYSLCLPAILPPECCSRARSLVNELGKHRQLEPPSLCTQAKAHIAKTFCGLEAVMEIHSIGEFVHKCLSSSYS